MADHKHLSKIVIALTTIAVIFCFLAVAYADEITKSLGGLGVRMEYESKLFDTDEVMKVEIKIDEEEYRTMLQNSMTEEYYVCEATVNGETVHNVAIRPKGNTSLRSIASDPTTDRYSFKLEFDHFVEGQTCYGLDKLILNNNYDDATNMKEAIIYDMYQFLGADASLYNYAAVYINGEYRGIYLALEGVEESFMLRNFGTQDGELYKPDGIDVAGGGLPPPPPGFDPSADAPPAGDPSELPPPPADSSDGLPPPPPGGAPDGLPPPPPGGAPALKPGEEGFDPSNPPPAPSNGADLNYTDDDPDSYYRIWDCEVTGTGSADHRRVVTALKNISEGNDLETYLDMDNILKYMAVHVFSVNRDSFCGHMTHNYYLYEYEGQLNIFPWDYNLSLGGMNPGMAGDATDMINDAIDTPFESTRFFDSILENEVYRERYHSYLDQLVKEYVYGGRFDETYNRIRNQIDHLVETDPTAFYSYDEYLTAVDILYATVRLRADSIEGQVNGSIPSTDEGRETDRSALIDGSGIDLTLMGSFDLGGPPGLSPAGAPPGAGSVDAPSDIPDDMPPPPEGGLPEGLPDSPPPQVEEDPADVSSDLPDAPPPGSDDGGLPPPPGAGNGEMPPPPGMEMSAVEPLPPANIIICVICLVIASGAVLIVNKGVRKS